MRLWKVGRPKSADTVVLSNKKLKQVTELTGLNGAATRHGFATMGAHDIELQLADLHASTVRAVPSEIADILRWFWIWIFSERAMQLAISLGCRAEDFWPCHFDKNPGERFGMLLPDKFPDILDVERSEFRHMLGDPPRPVGLDKPVFKPLPARLPPFFYVGKPGGTRTFGDAFVTGDFYEGYRREGLTGATYERVH